MDEEKKGIYRIVLVAILVISLGMLFFENVNAITGHAVAGSTPSNVTIQYFLAITFCNNLTEGIQFGDITDLPATDVNGTHNYDYDNPATNGTSYCINVSPDGNSDIDFCVKADGPMNTSTGEKIGLGNETYFYSTGFTNKTHPLQSSQVSFTTSYASSATNVNTGNTTYYRFWLDVPSAQPSGVYNNTIFFKGVTTGSGC